MAQIWFPAGSGIKGRLGKVFLQNEPLKLSCSFSGHYREASLNSVLCARDRRGNPFAVLSSASGVAGEEGARQKIGAESQQAPKQKSPQNFMK